jgi:hypothetical protein
MNKIILLFTFFVTLTLQIPAFNLVPLSKTNGAMCMDGSSAGIYLFDPDQSITATNKLMIYFEDVW